MESARILILALLWAIVLWLALIVIVALAIRAA